MRLFAATGVAVMALAGAASAESGFIDISRAQLDLEGAEGEATAISAAVSLPLRGHLDFQLDGAVERVEGADDDTFGGTVHLVGRNQGWMLGAFTGGLQVDSLSSYAVGAQGALYFKRFTLAGALAYTDSDDADSSGFLFRGEGRYFVSRDLRIDALAGFADYDTPLGSTEAVTFGAGAEFQFHETPVSVFGALARTEADLGVFDADVFRLGLRWNYDKDLATRDETGASLISAPNLLGVL